MLLGRLLGILGILEILGHLLGILGHLLGILGILGRLLGIMTQTRDPPGPRVITPTRDFPGPRAMTRTKDMSSETIRLDTHTVQETKVPVTITRASKGIIPKATWGF